MTDISFKNWASLTDKALAEQIGAFIRHHRMEQNKTQEELAASAAISRSTLSLLERGETVMLTTLIQVLRVLNQLEIMNAFEVNEAVSPLALAKMQKEKRQRASRKSGKNEDIKPGKSQETDW